MTSVPGQELGWLTQDPSIKVSVATDLRPVYRSWNAWEPLRNQVTRAHAEVDAFFSQSPRRGGRRCRKDQLRQDKILRDQVDQVRKRIASGHYTWAQAIAGIGMFESDNRDSAVKQAQRWVRELNDLLSSESHG